VVRWRRVENARVQDRRGAGGGGFRGGGGGMALPVGGGVVGLIVAVLFVLLGGGNLGGGQVETPPGQEAPAPGVDPDAQLVDYMEFIDVSVQDFWTQQFATSGQEYTPTSLILFEGQTTTACGVGTEQTGPFYCPADQQAYIDLDFFRDLQSRFGAPGDFAQAYVIAHEYGHHVQNVLGTSEEVRAQQQSDPNAANDLSVRLELQADCYAGVWGHNAAQQQIDGQPVLEPGDLEEGLTAASAVGDDRIQEQAGVEVNQESWTHGSAEQRARWFRAGFDSGDPAACDTFSGAV
jgi:uncharacterized protein